MHPNPAFRGTADATNIAFAKERGFGVLAVNSDNAPLLSHIPFILSADGSLMEAHLVRSNPIVAKLNRGQCKAVMAVSGGDAYVSPDWYGIDDQVPTWNYLAVHLRGTLELLPDDRLHDILERTSAQFELALAPKKPWKIDKMHVDAYQRMQRQIVPIAMRNITIEGTWKMSQNKAGAVALGAAKGVRAGTPGQETGTVAALMEQAVGSKQ